jgi:hypothetical protein
MPLGQLIFIFLLSPVSASDFFAKQEFYKFDILFWEGFIGRYIFAWNTI